MYRLTTSGQKRLIVAIVAAVLLALSSVGSAGASQWLAPGNVNGGSPATSDIAHVHKSGVNVWSGDGDGTYTVVPANDGWFDYVYTNGFWLAGGDADNDNNGDIVHIHREGVNSWFSDGDNTFQVEGTRKPSNNYRMFSGEWFSKLDVNGDSQDDLIHRHANGINIWRSQGRVLNRYIVASVSAPWEGYSFNSGTWLSPGDLDSNGNDDLLHWHPNGYVNWLSNGDGTFNVVSNNKPNPTYAMLSGQVFAPGNVRGPANGNPDIVHQIKPCLNNWNNLGGGTFLFSNSGIPGGSYSCSAGDWTPFYGDVNNDGLNDLAHIHSGGVNVWDGDTNFGPYLALRNAKPTSSYSMTSGEWLAAGNVDGDGSNYADLVHRHKSGVNVWLSDGAGGLTVVYNSAPWPGYSFE